MSLDSTQDSKPYQCGVKDEIQIAWLKNHAKLMGELGYTYYLYNFNGSGNLGYNTLSYPSSGSTYFTNYPVKSSFQNQTIGGYLENRFAYEGLKITPGVRMDYLQRTGAVTVDPRGNVTYGFRTGTTLSAGAGMYSSFFQVNPNTIINNNPLYAEANYAGPERATHTSASVEQVYDLYTFSIEGFNNYFHDLFETYPHFGENGAFRIGANTGRMRTYGMELMIRKKPGTEKNTWFGWASYTLTQAKERTGLFLPYIQGLNIQSSFDATTMFWRMMSVYDSSGNRWINYDYERVHSLKLVLGYIFGNHTISGQFQLFTSFPYTNIIGSELMSFPSFGGSGTSSFYEQIYNPKRNTAHYIVNHRLDLRYSHKETYSWGYVTWYIAIIDCYAPFFKPINNYETPYPFLPYIPGRNPKGYSDRETEGAIGFLGGIAPVLGVEVRF